MSLAAMNSKKMKVQVNKELNENFSFFMKYHFVFF